MACGLPIRFAAGAFRLIVPEAWTVNSGAFTNRPFLLSKVSQLVGIGTSIDTRASWECNRNCDHACQESLECVGKLSCSIGSAKYNITDRLAYDAVSWHLRRIA